MKTSLLKKLVISIFSLIAVNTFYAQSETAEAIEYMATINVQYEEIQKDSWAYVKKAAHSGNAMGIEGKRKELVATVATAKKSVEKMSTFKGDASYRDSVVLYLQMQYDVMNDDFSKLVDMEQISEESYDAMEAYMMAKEQADDKLAAAGRVLQRTEKSFAKKYNVTLTEGEKSKRTKNLEIAGETYKYYNQLYLIFFKPNKQETYLIDAMSKGDINAIEQNNSTLTSDASEALKLLAKVKAFKGDASLLNATKEMVKFYKEESVNKVPKQTDYFMKKEKFEKIQKAMASNKKPSNEEIDKYNKTLEEYNTAVAVYNKTNEELNKERSKKIDAWNKAAKSFLDRQIP
jgi:hypothetical protein